MAAKKEAEEKTIEESLKELDTIVEKLESREISLEDSDVYKRQIQRLPGRIYGEGFLHGSAGAGAGRKKGCEGWTVLCADRKSVYQEIFEISQSESCAGSFHNRGDCRFQRAWPAGREK